MLQQFGVVDRIRKLYFRSGAQEPELRFTLTPESLDDQSSRLTLLVDGQTVDDQHQAPRPVRMLWPGPQPGQVVATFYEKSGAGRPHLAFEGPWAWQRLLESAQLERLSDVKFRMTISTSGHRAQLLLEAPTVLNPYANNDLGGFGCQ